MKSLSALLVLGAAFCSIAGAAELADGVRAIVSDTVITDFQVRVRAGEAIIQLRRQYASQPQVFQQKAAETLNDAMQGLVDRQLVIQDFKKAGYSFPEPILDDIVRDEIRRRYGDHITMVKSLQEQGLTQEKLRQQIREETIVRFLNQKNISSEIIISPRKIEVYYQQHQDSFKLKDQVRLRMIVLDGSAAATAGSRKQLAEEIRSLITGGADFAQLAQIHSTGSQRKEGGDWGWIERSTLNTNLAEVAFALEPKQVSPVIETPDVCYLMRVEEKRAAHVQPLNEVRDEIEKTLLTEERARLQKKYVEKLRNKAFVRFF